MCTSEIIQNKIDVTKVLASPSFPKTIQTLCEEMLGEFRGEMVLELKAANKMSLADKLQSFKHNFGGKTDDN